MAFTSVREANTADVIRSLNSAMDQIPPHLSAHKHDFVAQSAEIPKISLQRREASNKDVSLSVSDVIHSSTTLSDTVLYLGYGSNLAAETFLGKRGIRPLAQTNVVVPSIHLTFDLPGIPYSEPCFGNCRYRSLDEKPSPAHPPYHKDAWKKGLVGVVYEVTKEDFAHIIATEGGGSSYHDVLVDCHPLSDDPHEAVPLEPTSASFKAHTLYVEGDTIHRPDPAYAQPSARYMKLILDGAEEHNLPTEYRHFLANIRTYHKTKIAQRLGLFVFLAIWGPFLMVFLQGAKLFARPDGTFPGWYAAFVRAMFTAVWASYDHFFFHLFGDGERTLEDDSESGDKWSATTRRSSEEKMPLLHEPPNGSRC